MEREACVCDHGFERSDLFAEIIKIIIIIIIKIIIIIIINITTRLSKDHPLQRERILLSNFIRVVHKYFGRESIKAGNRSNTIRCIESFKNSAK